MNTKIATPQFIKDDPALLTAYILGSLGLLSWKFYSLRKQWKEQQKPKRKPRRKPTKINIEPEQLAESPEINTEPTEPTMEPEPKYAALNKLATIRAAINHVLRQRMIKKAYGVGDDFEYIERMPWLGSYTDIDSPDTIDTYITQFKGQLADLAKRKKRLYDAPPYEGFSPKLYTSKYRYHMNDYGIPNEITLDKYIKLVNQAIEKRDLKKLREASKYWSIRGAITDPKAKEAITKAIEEYRKTNPETFE